MIKKRLITMMQESGKTTFPTSMVFDLFGCKTSFDRRQIQSMLEELVKDNALTKVSGKYTLSTQAPATRAMSKNNFKDKNISTTKNVAKNSYKDNNSNSKNTSKTRSVAKNNNASATKSIVKDSYMDKKRSSNTADTIKGVLKGHSKGFAFLIREDGGEDIFIPNRALDGAEHGDTVCVIINSKTKGDKIDGKVTSIISRKYTQLVGTYSKLNSYGFVIPDNKDYFSDIFVLTSNEMSAQDNDKVVVEITEYPAGRKPKGKIIEILGKSGDPFAEISGLIKSYGWKKSMPELAEIEADKLNSIGVAAKDISGRQDYRDKLTITIDGADAKDFDDAISIEKVNDIYRLYVHIADVSHYVKSGSAVGEEASARCTSVYLPVGVLPMIPYALSNGLCSLSEGNDRLTLTVVMDFDKKGKLVDQKIIESIINSSARMTYDEVSDIIKGEEEVCKKFANIVPMISLMQELSKILYNMRYERGSLDFESNESKIIIDEKYQVVEILHYEYKDSNRIIEEFMLAANETVAEFMCRAEYPFVFRVHSKPEMEKLSSFADIAKACGYNFLLRETIEPSEFQAIVNLARGTEFEQIISKSMLRSMQKAKYHILNQGHFGLAAKYYCHFTSPIRRYPDLVIHRVIKAMLKGDLNAKTITSFGKMCESCAVNSSEREIASEQCERDVKDYFKTSYMIKHLGEEFEGVISGVTGFGIFVELDNTIEGLIRTEYLPRAEYTFNESRFSLTGGKFSYNLGDKIKIVVASADIETRKIGFALAEEVNGN